MLIRKPPAIPSSEITPEQIFRDRRRFMTAGAAGLATAALSPILQAGLQPDDTVTPESIVRHGQKRPRCLRT